MSAYCWYSFHKFKKFSTHAQGNGTYPVSCPLRPSYHIVSSGIGNQFLITGLGKHGLREWNCKKLFLDCSYFCNVCVFRRPWFDILLPHVIKKLIWQFFQHIFCQSSSVYDIPSLSNVISEGHKLWFIRKQNEMTVTCHHVLVGWVCSSLDSASGFSRVLWTRNGSKWKILTGAPNENIV